MHNFTQNTLLEKQYTQGSDEWIALRKTKVTATDAPVIMGVSHWKNRFQLYNEKISDLPFSPPNERMQRGIELEPLARDLFNMQHNVDCQPKVVVKEWTMASLDGIDSTGKIAVEIKCPGEKDHEIAVNGRIPDHYYPQLQHQMYVCDLDKIYYFSFDGMDGVTVIVQRDQEYIDKLNEEEKKFYECLINKTPPENEETIYLERDDDLWLNCAGEWKEINFQIKKMTEREEELRKKLISLSGEYNCKGAGISLCKVERKGNIDYSKIKELKGVNLEPYRKTSSSSWRINQ